MPKSRQSSSLLVLASLAVSATAQLTWQRQSPPNAPSGRYGHAMAYHEARGRVVLFGGADDTVNKLDDTWEFDGVTWRLMTPSARPPARRWHSMVYDPQSRNIYVFGGDSQAAQGGLSDVWKYDMFGNWSHYPTASGPAGRYGHCASFDRRTGQMMVFGGTIGIAVTNDCWMISPPSLIWTQFIGPKPSPRTYAGMVYDARRGVTVLTGGSAGTDYRSDTWEFDGTWQQRNTVSAPLQQISLAYDSVRQRVLFLGGLALIGTSARPVDSHGEWDGTAWTFRQIPRPSQRTSGRLVFDPTSGQTVLFGGSAFPGALSDTWTLATTPATAAAFGTSCGGSTPQLVAVAPNDRPWVDSNFLLRLASLPTSSLAGVYLGVSRTVWAGVPLPLDLNGFGMTNCQQLVSGDLLLDVNSVGELALRIPATASLNGQMFLAQGVAFVPGANPANLVTSNGMTMQMGLR